MEKEKFLAIGMSVFSNLVLINNLKLFTFSNVYCSFSVLIILLSVLFYIMNFAIVSAIIELDSYNILAHK